MTREKIKDLNLNTLIGYTEKRGHAWHYREGAGNHFPGPVPMERIEKLFGWTALESDITYDVVLDDGFVGKVVDPTQKLYYRSDNGGKLGIHGKGHQRHQYMEWLVNNVTTLLGGELAIGQAGLLRGGAVAWVSIELADTLSTIAGIEIRPQLLNATSFDGSLASINKLVSTIVVCDNTMDIGLSEKSLSYKVKHSSKSKFDEEKARDSLGIVEAYAEAFGRRLDELVHAKVSDQQFAGWLDIHTPLTDQSGKELEKGRALTLRVTERETLTKLWNDDPRVSPWRGTQFGVLQAANTYLHHEQSVKGSERAERNAWRAVTTKKSESIADHDTTVLSELALALS